MRTKLVNDFSHEGSMDDQAVLDHAVRLLLTMQVGPQEGDCANCPCVSIHATARTEKDAPNLTVRLACLAHGVGDVPWRRLLIGVQGASSTRTHGACFDRFGQAVLHNLPPGPYRISFAWPMPASSNVMVIPSRLCAAEQQQRHAMQWEPGTRDDFKEVGELARPLYHVLKSADDRLVATVCHQAEDGLTTVAFETREQSWNGAVVHFAFITPSKKIIHCDCVQLQPVRQFPNVFEARWTGRVDNDEPSELVFGFRDQGLAIGTVIAALAPGAAIAPDLTGVLRRWETCSSLQLKRVVFEELVSPHHRGWMRACAAAVVQEEKEKNAACLADWLAERVPAMHEILNFGSPWQALDMKTYLRYAQLLLTPETPDRLERLRALAKDSQWPVGLMLDVATELTTPPEKWNPLSSVVNGRLRRSLRRLTVPVASVEMRLGEEIGVAGVLILELVPDGCGRIYPVPALGLADMDDALCSVELVVPQWLHTKGVSLPRNCDVRWQVRRCDSKPLAVSLNGNSLSAAFAAALYWLLNGEPAQDNVKPLGIAFLASCDQDGKLGAVGGLLPKLVAAIRTNSIGRVDTAVVADKQAVEDLALKPLNDDKTIWGAPSADFHVLCAGTMEEALRLLASDAQSRWHSVDCRLPAQNPDYVCPEKLVTQIRGFIDAHLSGYLVLVGGAGCGKSTFVAELIRSEQQRLLKHVIFHIIDYQPSATGSLRQIALCLYQQLQRKYGIAEPADWKDLDVEDKLEEYLAMISARVLVPHGEKEVLYLDAADQADLRSHCVLLPGTLRKLPPNVICIISSRHRMDWLHSFEGVTRWVWEKLDIAKPTVREYLERLAPTVTPPLPTPFIEAIVSQPKPPVFLTVVDHLRRLRDPATPPALVESLRTEPSRWCEPSEVRIQAEANQLELEAQMDGISHEQLWGTLGILAVARRELSERDLADLGLWEPTVTQRVLHLAANFFAIRPDTDTATTPYSFSHPAYHREVLHRLTTTCPHGESLCHSRLAHACREWHHLPKDSRAYALRYLPAHLRLSRSLPQLAVLLTDFDYLSRRLQSKEPLVVHNLLHDYHDSLYGTEALSPRYPDWKPVADLYHLFGQYSRELCDNPDLLLPLAYNSLYGSWTEETEHGRRLRDALKLFSQVWLQLQQPLTTPMATMRFHHLHGYGGRVRTVAYSPDEQWLASCTGTGTVHIHAVNDDLPLMCLHAHQEAGVCDVAFHPNGKCLVTTGKDGKVKFWSTTNWQEIDHWHGPGTFVRCLAYCRDGQWLAFATDEGVVGVLDIHTKTVRWQDHHDDCVFSLAISPDEQTLATSSKDKRVILWNLETGQRLRTHGDFDSWPEAVAFSPDKRTLAVGSGRHRWDLRIFDVHTGTQLYRFTEPGGGIRCLAFSSDGAMLAAGSYDQTVRIVDPRTGHLLYPVMAHRNWVNAVRFARDDRHLASAGSDRTVRHWHLAQPTRLSADPSHFRGGDVAVVNAGMFTADGRTLVAGHQDHTVRLYDAETRKMLEIQTAYSDAITSVAVSPDGAIVVSGSKEEIYLWNRQQAEPPRVLHGHRGWVNGIAWPANGQYFVSFDDTGLALLWGKLTGDPMRPLPTHPQKITAIAIADDGQTIATGGDDGQLYLWDTDTDQRKHCIAAHASRVQVIRFSTNGHERLVATGGEDGTVRVFNATTGLPLYTFEARCGSVDTLVFSPDHRYLASGSDEGAVHLWNIVTGQLVASLPCDHSIIALWFDSTGKELHVADDGGAMHTPYVYLVEIMNV